MFTPLKEMMLHSAERFRRRAHGRHAQGWLFGLSFLEAIVFPLPVDPLLIAILLADARRWFSYAVKTTAASVLGGVVGYGIGLLFFDTIGIIIVEFYGLRPEMETARLYYEQNAFLAIFLGAFTPLPYKIFVLSGGFFKVSFLLFLLASIVGRGARYTLVAWLTARWGAHAVRAFLRYFNIATAVLLLAFVAAVFHTFF